jgi:hypothetical protein
MKQIDMSLRNSLLRCAGEEMKREDCGLTPEQWCCLLNSYIRRESPELCAVKTGMKPIQADRWYIRLSLDLMRDAIRQSRVT